LPAKSQNVPGALSKTQAHPEPSKPNLVIDIVAVPRALESFQGEPYPFMPATVPCPKELQ